MKKCIYTSKAPAPIGPYSQAIMSQNTLYVSGQIAIDPATGQLVIDDIKKETNQVMQNIKAILTKAGLDFGNVVKSSIFIKDMNKFQQINEIYDSCFKDTPPARETVEVSRLPKDVNVEISVIAVVF